MAAKAQRFGIASSFIALALTTALALTGCNSCTSSQSRTSTTGETSASTATTEVTAEGQSLGLTGVKNAREFGGYAAYGGKTVKHGLLLRTGKLASATEADIATLKGLNLSTIIDLRSDYEKTAEPDPAIDGVTSIAIPIAADYLSGIYGKAMASELGKSGGAGLSVAAAAAGLDPTTAMEDFLSNEKNAPLFKQFFDVMLAQPDDQAILWHCSYGKDRTGVTAALLLSALGVDRETVLDDYALTNEFISSDISAAEGLARANLTDEGQIANVRGIEGVDRDAMEAALGRIDSQYGSVENYLEQFVGLSEADIQSLRAKYLE